MRQSCGGSSVILVQGLVNIHTMLHHPHNMITISLGANDFLVSGILSYEECVCLGNKVFSLLSSNWLFTTWSNMYSHVRQDYTLSVLIQTIPVITIVVREPKIEMCLLSLKWWKDYCEEYLLSKLPYLALIFNVDFNFDSETRTTNMKHCSAQLRAAQLNHSINSLSNVSDGSCSFQDNSEKQISVDEDTPPGTELFIVRAYPRRLFNIQALDGVSINFVLNIVECIVLQYIQHTDLIISSYRLHFSLSFVKINIRCFIKTVCWPYKDQADKNIFHGKAKLSASFLIKWFPGM